MLKTFCRTPKLEAAASHLGQRAGRSHQGKGMKIFDENISGRCLVFSCKLARDGVVIALKDSSSDCPDFQSKRTELAASKTSRS